MNLPTDPLTGVYTRAYYNQKIQEEHERSCRYQLSFALLVLDLDHFKSINDAFGHSRGDEVLVHFARLTQKIARATDFIFRYGGDEFVLLLPHTNLADAASLANRLLEAVKNSPLEGDPPISITISVGVAAFPADGETFEEVFETADKRNYAAKRAGRARVVAHNLEEVGKLNLLEPQRLLEREIVLDKLQTFFAALSQEPGILTAIGAEAAGHTRFLTEVCKAAKLRGYAVLQLNCNSALKMRHLGVLAVALAQKSHPFNVTDENLAVKIATWLREKNYTGLVVTVDQPAEIDRATFQFLTDLLSEEKINRLGLFFAGKGSEAVWFNAPLKESVNLMPVSEAGVQIWLRHALQWEVPPQLFAWFYQQTGGLPALIKIGLQILLDQRKLGRSEQGWQIAPDLPEFDLAEFLQQYRAKSPNNLPHDLEELVGREQELNKALTSLTNNRLLTLLGAGGIGKTRLALQIAAESLPHYGDGVFFVPLVAVKPDEEMLAAAILAALGVKPTSASLAQTLLNYIQDKRILLLLDNFEHLVEKSALLLTLLKNSSDLKLLVTSREKLRLPGEVVLYLDGLQYPDSVSDLAVSQYPAVQLFVQNVGNFREKQEVFNLEAETGQAVGRICQLVQGIPLGIKLAAAWVDVFSCQEIVIRLEQKPLSMLGESSGLGQLFDSFWTLLSEYEQALFAGLSVYQGGFGREVANYVNGASVFFLEGLVNRAFLSRNEQGRYEIHELLRQYLTDKNGEREKSLILERYSRYYYTLLKELSLNFTEAFLPKMNYQLSQEYPNLKAVMEWYFDHECITEGLEMATSLFGFWVSYNYFKEGRYYLERGLALLGSVNSVLQIRAMNDYGYLSLQQGAYDVALTHLHRSLELNQELGHKKELARTLGSLGVAANHLGNYEAAVDYLEQSIVLERELGDKRGLAIDLLELGVVVTCMNDLALAKAYCEESLQLSRELKSNRLILTNIQCLGDISLLAGDLVATKNYYNSALNLLDFMQDTVAISYVMSGNANLWANIGLAEDAPVWFERAAYLLGALFNMLKVKGIKLDSVERDRYEQTLKIVQANLSEDIFRQVTAEGALLSPEQAVQYLISVSKSY
jgi:diguanylate cyclase (GGDEF)-like protein